MDTHTCICTHTNTHKHAYACTYRNRCTHKCMHIHAHDMRTHTHTQTLIHAHLQTHAHTHTNTHTHMRTHLVRQSRPSYMWRDDNIRMRPQFTAGWQRFLTEHIQYGTTNPPLSDRTDRQGTECDHSVGMSNSKPAPDHTSSMAPPIHPSLTGQTDRAWTVTTVWECLTVHSVMQPAPYY